MPGCADTPVISSVVGMTTKPLVRPAVGCAAAGLLAPVAFTVGWIAGGLAQPEAHSLTDDAVSDLGALTASSPWLYNQIGANLTGVLVVLLAVGLWRSGLAGAASRIGVIALGLTGIGLFFDGLFRLDCQAIDAGCGPVGHSWNAIAHQIESVVTVLGLLVAVFALSRGFKKSPGWQDLSAISLAAGVTSVLAVIGLSFVGQGLGTLVALTVWFAWLALVSWRLMTIAREPERGLLATSSRR